MLRHPSRVVVRCRAAFVVVRLPSRPVSVVAVGFPSHCERLPLFSGGTPRCMALACAVIESWLVTEMGWQHLGTAASLIDGPDGNREFLLAGKKPDKAG